MLQRQGNRDSSGADELDHRVCQPARRGEVSIAVEKTAEGNLLYLRGV
jgi:hypothetical protein